MARNANSFLAAALLALVVCTPCHAQTKETAPEAKPALTITKLLQTPLTGDANRSVTILKVVFPPGVDSGYHHHPGDQYTLIEEGELSLFVNGQKSTVKPGEVIHMDPGVIHRTINEGTIPVRTTEFLILENGKPLKIEDPNYSFKQ